MALARWEMVSIIEHMNATLQKRRVSASHRMDDVSAAELYEEVVDATEKLVQAQDELEDYLFMTNPDIVRVLKNARKEQLAGKTKDLGILLRKHGIQH